VTTLPRTQVIIFTTYLSEELVKLSQAAGASAFVTKASGLGELRRVLEQIERLGSGFIQGSTSSIVHRLAKGQAEVGGAPATLTPRQEHVLTLAAEGLTYGEIALRLCISQSTVRFHIQTLKERLGARTKTELISVAIRRALIAPTPDAVH
jgi:DNA-binding NarL/FixJ family response regulator